MESAHPKWVFCLGRIPIYVPIHVLADASGIAYSAAATTCNSSSPALQLTLTIVKLKEWDTRNMMEQMKC